MLENIKELLGISSTENKDKLITILINQAIEEIKTYTRRDDIGDCESLVVAIVIYNYNRLSTEGLDSESYSGVNFHYSTDYPESIMRQLKAKRKIQVC